MSKLDTFLRWALFVSFFGTLAVQVWCVVCRNVCSV